MSFSSLKEELGYRLIIACEKHLIDWIMESMLIVQSSKVIDNQIIEINASKFPNLKKSWRARTTAEAVRMIRKHKPGLVILDVNLELGMDFGVFELTKDIAYHKIILCDSADYVFKVLRYDIDDYLLKPVGIAEIEASLERLLFQAKQYKIQQLYDNRKSISSVTLSSALIETVTGSKLIDMAAIVRIVAQDDVLQLHIDDGDVEVCPWPMKRLLGMLAGNGFVCVNPDQVINCAFVKQVDTKGERLQVVMRDGHRLHVPLRVEDRLRARLSRGNTKPMEQYPRAGWQ